MLTYVTHLSYTVGKFTMSDVAEKSMKKYEKNQVLQKKYTLDISLRDVKANYEGVISAK